MAIQKMNFVTLIGPVEKFDFMIEKIYRSYEFHFENASHVMAKISGLQSFTEKNPYVTQKKEWRHILDELGLKPEEVRTNEKKERKEVDLKKIQLNIQEKGKAIQKKRRGIEERKKQVLEMIYQLQPLENLEAPIQNFLNMKYIQVRFGKFSADNYKKYKMFIEESESIIYIPIRFSEDSVWGFYFTTRGHLETADTLFHSLYFEVLPLPEQAVGKPKEILMKQNEQLSRLEEELMKAEQEWNQFVAENKQEVLEYYSEVKRRSDIFEMRHYCVRSEKECYIVGWIRENEAEKFKMEFEPDPMINYVLEKPGHLDLDLTPPTKLKNFWIFRPFEEFVAMYGLPCYGELDPTAFMAITYVLLFGIMFGDLGQGFCVLLLGLILAWKKWNLGRILIGCGGSSMIFGVFYGSIFGFEDILPGFHTLENRSNINLTIMASIGIGMILVSIAMFLNIYNGIKQRNLEKILFHYNGLAGFIFYWGIIFAVLSLFGFGMNDISPVYILFVVVIPLLFIYLKEPLGKLASRKKDWKPKNVSGYLIENLFELFEVVLSYVTNTVSFIRVGAFALNHAGMMLAVFILSRMFGESQNMIVIVLGNLFVMGMEGLIVGIQVLRLEFYEMFSRFFSGEGRAFQPFVSSNGEK